MRKEQTRIKEKPVRDKPVPGKTKYIVTEYYRNKIELKDAVVDILYVRYKARKQNKTGELSAA